MVIRPRAIGRDLTRAYIYLLFEHQSTSEPLMALRMLGYLVRIWEKIVKDRPNAKAIPAVIPLVLYHGKEGWHAAKSFGDLIDIDEQTKRALRALIPDFRYILDDLNQQSDEQLRARALSEAGMLSLLFLQRLLDHPDPEGELKKATDLVISVINAPSGVEALGVLIWYAFRVSDPDPSRVKQWLEIEVGGRALEAYMTAADRMTEETRKIALAEGEAKGKAEGRAEILRKLLTLKFGALSPEAETRLGKASVAELDHWAERVLSAQRIDDVFV